MPPQVARNVSSKALLANHSGHCPFFPSHDQGCCSSIVMLPSGQATPVVLELTAFCMTALHLTSFSIYTLADYCLRGPSVLLAVEVTQSCWLHFKHILDVQCWATMQVDYYGAPTPLKTLAGISAPESTMLVVQPYDKSAMQAIEKAIMQSDIGATPSNDGNLIRINIPALTTVSLWWGCLASICLLICDLHIAVFTVDACISD